MIFSKMRSGAILAMSALALGAVAPELSYAQSASQQSQQQTEDRAQERQRDRENPPRQGRGRSASRQAAPASAAALRERGMQEAPAVAQRAGVACTITDAKLLGTNPQTRAVGYEVACSEGLGYLLIAPPAPAPVTVQNCLLAEAANARAQQQGGSSTTCTLSANANPHLGLQPVVQRANQRCTVARARAMGQLANGTTRYEVGCTEGAGFLLDIPTGADAQPSVITCLEAAASNIACEYTPREQLVAQVGRLLQGQQISGQPINCQPSNYRLVGRSAERGTTFTEIACGEEAGYIVEADAAGAVKQVVPCARASHISGGCTLTNAQAAETADAALYTADLQRAGFTCDVSRYNRMGRDRASGREVVEVVCNGREGGAIAFLPIPGGANQTAEVIDCVRAAARGVNCTLTPLRASYASLTQEVRAKGAPCTVTEIRGIGTAADGAAYAEIACQGDQRGFIVDFRGPQTIQAVTPCHQAQHIGGGCRLPANAAGRLR